MEYLELGDFEQNVVVRGVPLTREGLQLRQILHLVVLVPVFYFVVRDEEHRKFYARLQVVQFFNLVVRQPQLFQTLPYPNYTKFIIYLFRQVHLFFLYCFLQDSKSQDFSDWVSLQFYQYNWNLATIKCILLNCSE